MQSTSANSYISYAETPQVTDNDACCSSMSQGANLRPASTEDATAAAAAAAAKAAADAGAVAAQWRQQLVYDLFGKRKSYVNMAIMPARGDSNGFVEDTRQDDGLIHNRQMYNERLLNLALRTISKMDPPFLEVLCHAIHAQITASLPQ